MAIGTDTVVVGGGQAGLATSHELAARGIEHLVLERAAAPGETWSGGRWDSFTLVTPNWAFRLPGAEYGGPEPDGFMPLSEVVDRLTAYAARLPVRFDSEVGSVRRDDATGRFAIELEDETIDAANVVVATGMFQAPRVPAFAGGLTQRVTQLPSGAYRRPSALPEGAVLVVGSAQSGCQIAQELYENGRKVFLCVGGAGRVPRRYRGRDIVEWMDRLGFFDMTADDLPTPAARFTPNPSVSGRDGGRRLDLHRFARDGVGLLGHLRGADGERIALAADLHESLAKADTFETDLARRIDDLVEREHVDAPPEELPHLTDGYDVDPVTELRLDEQGIATVIWAIGYTFDFSFVDLPVLDGSGYPIQQEGATAVPGLYFIGLPFLTRRKSGLFMGVGEDARAVAESIAARS